MKKITRPVLRYPGGKYLLAKWVINHFPPHRVYVELFGGAASVLMRKPRSVCEVYNEIDENIVDVFRVLRNRDQAEELARLISLTPMAYWEYKAAYETSNDPIERARRAIFRSFAGIGSDSVSKSNAGFRGLKNSRGMTAGPEWSRYPQAIRTFTERLEGVVIEGRDALKVIDIYDREETLFYADPPYPFSTRSRESVRYVFEYSDEDHVRLAERLHRIRGMAIVSCYPCELYKRLYADWRKVEHSARTQTGKRSIEVLWLSPNIQAEMF